MADQFNIWNAALQTGDEKKVAALYASNGVLLPTVSNKVRFDNAGKVSEAASLSSGVTCLVEAIPICMHAAEGN